MAGKSGRKPQEWALRMAQDINDTLAGGKPIPYVIEGLSMDENGMSIRFLQEVGFAKSWLERREEELHAQELKEHMKALAEVRDKKRGDMPAPLRALSKRFVWSVKRELQADGSYIFKVGLPTSGSHQRGPGKMHSLMTPFLNQQDKDKGKITMEGLIKQQEERKDMLPSTEFSVPVMPMPHLEEGADPTDEILKNAGYY